MDDLTLGQRIAQKRKMLGLSQEALGEKLEVSRQSVSKWEADAAIPELDKLIAMSRLFEVSIGTLLGTEDPIAEEGTQLPQQPDGMLEQDVQTPRKKWLTIGVAAMAAVGLVTSVAGIGLTAYQTKQLATVQEKTPGITHRPWLEGVLCVDGTEHPVRLPMASCRFAGDAQMELI